MTRRVICDLIPYLSRLCHGQDAGVQGGVSSGALVVVCGREGWWDGVLDASAQSVARPHTLAGLAIRLTANLVRRVGGR